MYDFFDVTEPATGTAWMRLTWDDEDFAERVSRKAKNAKDVDWCVCEVVTATGRGQVAIEHDTETVPGRAGLYAMGSRHGVREITVTGRVTAGSAGAFFEWQRLVNSFFRSGRGRLWLSDDPKVFYRASFQRLEIEEEGALSSFFRLVFVCYDPFAYSVGETVKEQELNRDTMLAVDYWGDVDAPCVVELKLLEAVSGRVRVILTNTAEAVYVMGDRMAQSRLLIDMKSRNVWVNDRPANHQIDIINSRFFRLRQGRNHLAVNVPCEVRVSFREVFI